MSLYLKYRPKTFDDLVGQTFVKTNLRKAIEEGKTVGAYLLCGPRGTGKTTSARLLAKGVNCEFFQAIKRYYNEYGELSVISTGLAPDLEKYEEYQKRIEEYSRDEIENNILKIYENLSLNIDNFSSHTFLAVLLKIRKEKDINSDFTHKISRPCLHCKACKDFESESLVDVIEIDAASNTGVDNIREIIERAKFQPTQTKYKVYIIDEVHMLSKGAFNALLKILEEPPSHVKFILATTEVHKIPETILSRCQRYDFKRITSEDIRGRLAYVCEKEGFEFEEKALEYIASISDGALRNALSLLEQYVIDNEVKYQNIVDNLGIVTQEELDKFFEKMISKDESVISDFEKLSSEGKNLKLFVKDLLYYSSKKMTENLNSPNLAQIIKIVEELNSSYVISKNSFDENVPFIVSLVKIVTGVKPIEEVPEPIMVGVNTTKNEVKTAPQTPTQKEVKVEKEEMPPLPDSPDAGISEGDVFDLFAPSEPEPVSATPMEDYSEQIQEVKPKLESNFSTNFDFKEFTALVRKSQGFAFIGISLTKATYRFEEGTLIIIPQNEAVYNKFNTIEVMDLFRDTVLKLGFDYNIKLEL